MRGVSEFGTHRSSCHRSICPSLAFANALEAFDRQAVRPVDVGEACLPRWRDALRSASAIAAFVSVPDSVSLLTSTKPPSSEV